jgi:hypothetical protein
VTISGNNNEVHYRDEVGLTNVDGNRNEVERGD